MMLRNIVWICVRGESCEKMEGEGCEKMGLCHYGHRYSPTKVLLNTFVMVYT